VKWITALHLEQWAATTDSRTRLSELVAELVRASVKDPTSFRFPTGDSAQLPGYDGRLACSEGSLYVPTGESVWEFGTESDYLKKANKDYSDRTAKPGLVNPSVTTFVFVTPYTWKSRRKTREKWIQERLTQGIWADVRIVDGVALEDWLELNPAVGARLARQMLPLIPPTGVRSTDEFWEEYATRFSPALTEDVLLADRQDQANELLNQLTRGPMSSVWQADSTEEATSFVVAAIRKTEANVRKFLEARMLIVDTVEAARQLAQKTNMVFLPRASGLQVAGLLAQRNLVIVPIGRDAPNGSAANVLKRPTTGALTAALLTMGVGEERALHLARLCGRSVRFYPERYRAPPPKSPTGPKMKSSSQRS
jgi:hypothetical protein